MSSIKKVSLASLFYFNYFMIEAQSITEDAISIKTQNMQLESVAVIEYFYNQDYHLNHWVFPGILLRYGLNDYTEIRWATAYESVRKHIHKLEKGNINQMEIGFKLHLARTRTFNLALVNHFIFPRNLEDNLSEASILIGSVQFTPTFSMGTSIQYTFTNNPENDFNYSLAFYYDLTKKTNIYAETYGELLNTRLINQINIGANYIVNNSLEWQIGYGVGITQINRYLSTGLVWIIN